MNRSHFFALPLFTALTAGTVFAQQDPMQVTGKQGFVTLKADTKVGDAVLKPGTYIVEHEMTGKTHVLTFWKMGDPSLAQEYSDEALVGEPVSVACKLESLPSRVKHTEVATAQDDKLARVVKVEIKGENVAHEL
jgi:hypothetical protein